MKLSALVIDGQHTFNTIKKLGLFKKVYHTDKLIDTISLLNKENIKVIFTDPILNQENIVKKIKENCSDQCIIIVLTDKTQEEELSNLAEWSDDFLDKGELTKEIIKSSLDFSTIKKRVKSALCSINERLQCLN